MFGKIPSTGGVPERRGGSKLPMLGRFFTTEGTEDHRVSKDWKNVSRKVAKAQRSFQALELLTPVFPNIGKNFSRPWKDTSFFLHFSQHLRLTEK